MTGKSSKTFFLMMRGVGLFFKFLPKSIGALSALLCLFTMLHLTAALFMSAKTLADTVTRVGKLRVYTDNLSKDFTDKLLKLEGVKSAEIYDKKRAAEFLRSYAQVDASLDAKFFPSFVELELADNCSSLPCLEELSEKAALISGVVSASYGKAWSERIGRGKRAVLTLMALSSVLFSICAAVLAYQTVGINLYRYKLEAEVYGILGATGAFIYIPFMVMAALFALAASILSLIFRLLFLKTVLSPMLGVLELVYSDNALYPLFFTAFFTLLSALCGYLSAVRFSQVLGDRANA